MDAAAAQHIREAFYAGLWFTIAVCVGAFLTHRKEDYAPMRWQLWRDRYLMSRGEKPEQARGSVRNGAESAGSNPELEPEPMANLALESRTDDRTGAFALNDAERLAVTKMIYHKASDLKATKASAVYAGFGVKKGDSAAYRRASAIYDALFVLPERDKYPLMTDEQRASREELGLVVR